ncbi:uncharacterized protein LOC123922141 [Trifolium pratense]|uniref:uncharacterized protein LOC123922141 n=1 Tax=Trifolium pratense TaxID=57577 RepID=UPI001E697EE7|nr:uncharacterized protein LOC123922141 [Trifolium pratense]
MGSSEPKSKTSCCRTCILVTLISWILVALILLVLAFTVFKPQNPIVNLYPIGLKDMQFFDPNVKSVPMHMIISIKNPNYGDFKTKNATGYIHYKHTLLAKVPIGPKFLPARTTTNVSATAGLMSGQLLSNDAFLKDIEDEIFNMTASTTLNGKVYLIRIFKLKAMVDIACEIKLNITSMDTDSLCITNMKV